MKLIYLFYVVLACTLFSCSSKEVNREKLGNEIHLMTDANGNVWIIEHHSGDLYTVKFLRDSLDAR